MQSGFGAKGRGLTRRHWLAANLALVTLIAGRAPRGQIVPPSSRGAPQISFHMDQPFLDPDGAGHAYQPPAGLRGAAVLEGLDEDALRRLSPFH